MGNLVRFKIQDRDKVREIDISSKDYLKAKKPDYHSASHNSDTTISSPILTPDGILHATPQALEDLEKGIIRPTKKPRVAYADESIQLLRNIRQVASLNQDELQTIIKKLFTLADNPEEKEDVSAAIRECAHLLLADETLGKVNYHLRKTFFHSGHQATVKLLTETGVLETVFKEFAPSFAGLCDFITSAKDKTNSLSVIYDYFLNGIPETQRDAVIAHHPLLKQHYDYVEDFAREPLNILREINRAACFEFPLRERATANMFNHLDKLLETPEKSNALLKRIISGTHYEKGIRYFVDSGAFCELFPELIEPLGTQIDGISKQLVAIIGRLEINKKGDRSLTDFYDQLQLCLDPTVKSENVLIKTQYDYVKKQDRTGILSELNEWANEEKQEIKYIHRWLQMHYTQGNAEWLFTVLCQQGALTKFFPRISRSMIEDYNRLQCVMVYIDDLTQTIPDVLSVIYANFVVSAAHGDPRQLNDVIQRELRWLQSESENFKNELKTATDHYCKVHYAAANPFSSSPPSSVHQPPQNIHTFFGSDGGSRFPFQSPSFTSPSRPALLNSGRGQPH